MGSERILMLKLLGDTSSLDKAVTKSSKGLRRFGRTVSRWGTAILADVAITGVEKLTDALGDAWTGFREGEKAAGQLGQTWKNLGLDGSGLQRTIDQISARAKRLGVDDTESVQAFNQALLATGGKPKQAMDRLRIAQDLVANGSAPNLKSALGIVAQASKGSAKTVDKFGLTSKTAAGRVKQLGEKVAGAAKKKADLDPLGVLFNDMGEDLEGIVGALSQGDLEGAIGSLGQIGTDVGDTWSKLYDPISKTLDKLTGGSFSDIAASIGGLLDKVSSAAEADVLPKLREGFEKLQAVWDGLQPHVQNALDAIQPLVDIFGNVASGSLGLVLDTVNGALSTIAALLNGDFTTAFTDASDTVNKIGENVNTIFQGIPAAILGFVGDIGTAAKTVGFEILNKVLESPGLIATWLESILTGESGIVGKLGGAVSAVGEAALGIGKGIYDGVVEWVGDLPDKLVGLIRGAVNSIIGVWNQLDFAIPAFTLDLPGVSIPNPMHGTVLDPFGTPYVQLLGETHAKVFSGTGDLIPDIKPLAEGGIVTGPTLALIGEGRHDEAVVPLDGRHGMGDTYITLNVTVHAAPGANGFRIGQELAGFLEQYARGGGQAHLKRLVTSGSR